MSYVRIIKLTLCFLALLGFTVTYYACNSASFGGMVGKGGGKKKKDNTTLESSQDPSKWTPPDGVVNENTDENDPILIFNEDVSGFGLIQGLDSDHESHVWTANTGGMATHSTLNEAGTALVDTLSWTGLQGPQMGTRTYVLEGGSVIMTRQEGHIHWIDPNETPEGALPLSGKNYKKISVPGGSRTCAVSYRKKGDDDKLHRYIGLGWGNSSTGGFLEFRQDDEPPYAPQWSNQTGTVSNLGASAGYNCFIDQKRLIYYTGWGWVRPVAVDLNTMKIGSLSSAPNHGFVADPSIKSSALGTDASTGTSSYAFSGDNDGNILRGDRNYTYTYEPVSNTIWETKLGGYPNSAGINIYPKDCFSKENSCTGWASYSVGESAPVGPISALKNGIVIGMSRTDHAVYAMKLVDPNDPASGIEVTNVGSAGGQPYMYTDFTGATLYITESNNIFDMTTKSGYEPGKKILGITFTWVNFRDAGLNWEDIDIEARCYKEGGDKGEFTDFTDSVGDAYSQLHLKIPSCSGTEADTVEVHMTQKNGNDTLMGVKKIQVSVFYN